MAYINERLVFKGDETFYEAYLNDYENVFISEKFPEDEYRQRFIVIDREEWQQLKEFIDRQFSELEK